MEDKLEAAHFTKFFHKKKKQNAFFPPKKSPTSTAGQRTKKAPHRNE